VEPLTEQQMRALEMRAESLRHLSSVALALAGVLAGAAGTVLKDMDPLKVMLAAGCFLLTALASLIGQERIIKAVETGKDLRRKILVPTLMAQLLFGAGWAMLVAQGARLAGV
jgi:hypothetical protein